MIRKHKNRTRGLIAFATLCLIVVIGGFALAQNNLLQNPLSTTFRLFSTTEMREMPEGIDGVRPEPPEGVDFEAGEMPEGGGTMEFWNIQWDSIGNVFYNLWVMLTTTVIMIVIARPIGYLVKHIKPRRKMPATA